MSEIRDALTATIDAVCEDLLTRELRAAAERGEWQAGLWQALAHLGLDRALLPEAAGGAGLAVDDALAALRRTAWHALPAPLAETMVAGRLLAAAGLDVPQGPITLAPVRRTDRLALDADGRLHGDAHRVPWGGDCPHVVVVVVAGSDAGQTPGARLLLMKTPAAGRVVRNLAGEPRVSLRFDGQHPLASGVLPGGPERLLLDGALVRCVQMTGALERILDHSLRYAGERVQFGRPIARFQAVQHLLAVLAGQVAAATAVTDLAIESADPLPSALAVAIAKARVGEAAGRGAEIAHQVHGAMGYTHEHPLHHSTRRLWAWREEFGNESHWQVRIGRQIAAAGADALWPLLAGA